MEIVWDEPKRVANIGKHGLDFAVLTPDFFLASVIIPAKRKRAKAIGRLNDGTIVVIFTRLGTEGLSIISMRPARRDERRLLDGKKG